jgi:hypothetical protein
MNASLDMVTSTVALLLIVLASWAALRTRSLAMRIALVTIVVVVIALMLWNLSVHGGLHAV